MSAFVAQSKNNAGVYLKFAKGEIGDRLFEALKSDREEISSALGIDVQWDTVDGRHYISTRQHFSGDLLSESRATVLKYLTDCTERFVAVFRPRIETLLREAS